MSPTRTIATRTFVPSSCRLSPAGFLCQQEEMCHSSEIERFQLVGIVGQAGAKTELELQEWRRHGGGWRR